VTKKQTSGQFGLVQAGVKQGCATETGTVVCRVSGWNLIVLVTRIE